MKTFSEFIKITEELHPLKTAEELAKKHKVPISYIKKQLKIGHKIECEHTKNDSYALRIASHHIDEFPDYYERLIKMEKQAEKEHNIKEGTLHQWFKGSKSKDGKPGWVQADGSTCANEPGETKTPKCFSSDRLSALKKKGKKGKSIIRSAVNRKRKEDPNQQDKVGSAKPTMVKTFTKGKKNKHYVRPEPSLNEAKKDIPGKGSGTKDSCYYKVKSRFKVWPSAYGSAALVRCRKSGASNWGNKSKVNEQYTKIKDTGNTYSVFLLWKGTYRMIQFFVSGFARPTKYDIENEVNKIYPDSKVLNFKQSIKDPSKPYFFFGNYKKNP